MDKKEIAKILKQTANLLEVAGSSRFRVNAFRGASRSIGQYEGDLEQLWSQNKLTQIPGVGKGIAAELDQFFREGSWPTREALLEEIPAQLLEIFEVQGLGPKRAGLFYRDFGVQSLSDLKELVDSDRLLEVAGFGVKTLEKLRASVDFAIRHQSALLVDEARALSHTILTYLETLPEVHRAIVGGELVVGEKVITQLSFAIALTSSQDLINLPWEGRFVASDYWEGTVDGVKIALFFTELNHFGALETYVLSQKAYWNYLIEEACSRGYELLPSSLRKEDSAVSCTSKEELLSFLGLNWVTPEAHQVWLESREHYDALVTLEDIRGHLHSHTQWSDGVSSLVEAQRLVGEQKMEYLAITDHSQSLKVAHGLSPQRLAEQWKEIETLNQNPEAPCILLRGLECDILTDGKLDHEASTLREGDFIVAAVHTAFNLSSEEMTDRVIAALSHPEVDALAHPTGRVLRRREGYAIDMVRVLEKMQEMGQALELNCAPARLDADVEWLRYFRDKGGVISLGVDAHTPKGYEWIRWGVQQARRAGLTAKDIVNTWTVEEIRQWRSKRLERWSI